MRVLVTATMAASALAIGLTMDAAQSAPLGSLSGAMIGSPDTGVQHAQQKSGPGGQQGQGMGGSGQGGGPSMGGGGGKSMQDGGGKMRGDGGGLREGGSQFRSGDKGMRGDGGGRSERGARGGRGGVEFGYREGGGRRYIDRDRGDRDRRHFGGRGGVYFGPGYGYLPSGCNWLRRRALETDSPYWWRRYRACRGG